MLRQQTMSVAFIPDGEDSANDGDPAQEHLLETKSHELD